MADIEPEIPKEANEILPDPEGNTEGECGNFKLEIVRRNFWIFKIPYFGHYFVIQFRIIFRTN